MTKKEAILFFLFLSIIVLGSSFVSSQKINYNNNKIIVDEIEGFSKGDFTFTLSDNVAESAFVGWSCDMKETPSILEIGTCYCIDLKKGFGEHSVGSGNLLNCLKNNNYKGIYTYLDSNKFISNNQFVSLNISLYYEAYNEGEGLTSIVQINSDESESILTCSDDYTGNYKRKYFFYVENPFKIIQSGYNSNLDLSNLDSSVLKEGNEIKCRVSYYDSFVLKGSFDSQNAYSYFSNLIFIKNVYITPAYPKIGDTVTCRANVQYGFNESYLIENELTLQSIFQLFVNGVSQGGSGGSSVLSNSFVKVFPIPQSKGVSYKCELILSFVDDNYGEFNVVSKTSSEVVIANTIPFLYDPIISHHSFILGDPVIKFYNQDAKVISKLTSKGVIILNGIVLDYQLCNSNDIIFKINQSGNISGFDINGNYCGNISKSYSSYCDEGFLNIKNENEVMLSISSNNFCYKGYLIEEAELWDI